MTCIRVVINAWFWNRAGVGLAQYLKWLVWGLLQTGAGLEIILVAPQPFRPGPEAIYGRLPNLKRPNPDNLELVVRPTPFKDQSSHLARLWFEQVTFPTACGQLKADLAHVPYYGAPFRSVKPLVVTVHDLIPLVLPAYKRNLVLNLYGRLLKTVLPKADLLLTDSQASQTDILSQLKAKPEQLRVIPMAPAPYFELCPTTPAPSIHSQYHLPAHYILYVGGFDKRKNVETVIQAFQQAKPNLPAKIGLVLAGNLPKKQTATESDPRPLVRHLGLTKDVHFPGWIAEDDLPALYRAAAVFVYLSRYEGFGLPVLEAMACGTAVITSNTSALPEIAGSAAVLVDPDDVTILAEQIVRLCTDHQANHRLARSGINQAQQFSWPKTAAQTLHAYQELLS